MIGDKGCLAIQKILPQLPNLELLYLKNNNIRDLGALHLKKAIETNSSLKLLNLCKIRKLIYKMEITLEKSQLKS